MYAGFDIVRYLVFIIAMHGHTYVLSFAENAPAEGGARPDLQGLRACVACGILYHTI